MPECDTRAEAVRAGPPITIGAFTLLPIERVALHAQRRGARLWFTAAIEPYALVVRAAGGLRAIDAEAVEVSLDALRKQAPELESALSALRVPAA